MTSTQPAMPGAGREPLADRARRALARDRLEDELVRVLVEEEDRGRARARRSRAPPRRSTAAARGGPPRRASTPAATAARRLVVVIGLLRDVVGGQVEDALELERRQLRDACARTSAQMPDMCGVAKLFPVQRMRAAAEPGDLDVDAAREELDGRRRVVEERERVRSSSWLPTEMTDEKRHGKLSTGMLCAEATSDRAAGSRRCRRARAARRRTRASSSRGSC